MSTRTNSREDAEARSADAAERAARNLKPRGVKAPLNLIPARPLRVIAAAMEDGANRYAPWNWIERRDDDRDVYGAALRRHVEKFTDPTEPDYADDSKIHHLAHAGACILILLHKLGIDYPARDPNKLLPGTK
ncbi:MAG: hypothetical protein JSV86_10440 [Gemmatimonadota bacterium]|nr:MAG: hypothetical protein JSV86_10440 [Gemmatimonadota bacterium]